MRANLGGFGYFLGCLFSILLTWGALIATSESKAENGFLCLSCAVVVYFIGRDIRKIMKEEK